MKYKVFDDLNSSLKFAEEIEAWDAKEAAETYAEQDIDGNIDGIYTSDEEGSCGLIRDLQKDGQPIYVVDEEGKTYYFVVGITEYTPTYEAIEVKNK